MNKSQVDAPLTTMERKALKSLAIVDWEWPAKLRVGRETTIAQLLYKGFVELHPTSMPGFEKIRITEAGKEALARPVAEKPERPKLKMLEPRLTILDPRIPSKKKGA